MKPLFLDDLCHRLRQQGVSRRYVNRLAGELLDHFDALRAQYARGGADENEAARLAERQLGDPEELIREVVLRQRVGRIVRGYPFVVFALTPIPLTLAVALAFALVGTASYLFLVRVLHISGTDATLRFVYHQGFYGFAYGLTPVLALAYSRLAARYGCPVWMPLVSSILLCAAGGFLVVHFVQCRYTGSVKYFQWWGIDAFRIWLPLAVFAAHAAQRLVREHVARRTLLR